MRGIKFRKKWIIVMLLGLLCIGIVTATPDYEEEPHQQIEVSVLDKGSHSAYGLGMFYRDYTIKVVINDKTRNIEIQLPMWRTVRIGDVLLVQRRGGSSVGFWVLKINGRWVR